MNNLTLENLDNSKEAILTDIIGRNSLLVSFGGIYQGLGIPVFEFFNSLSNLNCDKIFIRDFHQAWYHRGLNDHIQSIDDLKGYLEGIIKNYHYSSVCMIGNSMGGYAALLFGKLLHADRIISFAPQTFIDRLHRIIYLDQRWRKQISTIHKYAQKQPKYFDLKHLLKMGMHESRITIFYSSGHRLDSCHAERLKGIQNVELISFNEGGHQIVKKIRENGELIRLLSECLETTQLHDPLY